jgi:hypothetical protein
MANTWECRDCGQVVAFYADGGWEHESHRHLATCEYWDEENVPATYFRRDSPGSWSNYGDRSRRT